MVLWAVIGVYTSQMVRRLLWSLLGALGAFTAVAAGWQAFGQVGPIQFVLAGVTALFGGAIAFSQTKPNDPVPVTASHNTSNFATTSGTVGRPTQRTPRELPPDISDFTGREDELTRITSLLRHPPDPTETAPHLIAIAGKGGLGKTTLAVRAAQLVVGSFPDGQLFTNLHGYDPQPSGPAELLGDFLRTLGVEAPSIPDAVDDRAQLFRTLTADRRMLIVLDNANGPRQVRPLLPGTATCAVIITSRGRLNGLEGAHTIMLDVLSQQEALDLLARVLGAGRVAVEKSAAERLVALCGFLPLAVRIAGARLAEQQHLSIAALTDRLADERRRLDQLEIGDLDVRSTFMISYESLSKKDQRTFRLLGMCPGPDFAAWPLAALMELTLSQAEHYLEALVSAQLLDAIGPDETGAMRYRFHDLLRALAREQLDKENFAAQEAAARRLAGAYLSMAAQAEELFQPGELRKVSNHTRWPVDAHYQAEVLRNPIAWVIAERPNLVACVQFAYHRELWDATWELAHILAPFFEMLAYWDDWQRTQTFALEASRRSGSVWAEAIVLYDFAALHRDRGHLDDALAAYREALAGYTESGDRHGMAAVHLGQGIIYRNRREWDLASEQLRSGLEIFKTTGDRRLTAQTLRSLAIVRSGQRQFDESIGLFSEALQEFQELGDRRAEAYTWRGIGQAKLDSGSFTEAAGSFHNSLTLTKLLRDRRGEARALQGLGRVNVAEGAITEAQQRYAQAMAIAEDVGDTTLITELTTDISIARQNDCG